MRDEEGRARTLLFRVPRILSPSVDEVHSSQDRRNRTYRNLALHKHRNLVFIIREPNREATLLPKYATGFEDRFHYDAIKLADGRGYRFLPMDYYLERIVFLV
jgi:hypothetical protein